MALLCLVIEGEEQVASQRRREFARLGLRAYVVPSLLRAFEALESWHFNAIVLGASVTGPRLFELLRLLRTYRKAPILVLIDKFDEMNQIATLESGATDVMQSSTSSELLAVKLLRLLDVRSESLSLANEFPPHVGSLTIDERAMLASVDGVALDLTPYQFQLVALLASKSGEVVTRQEVVQILMGASDVRVVDTQVSRIRKKLKDMNVNDVVVRTVRGQGYSLATSRPRLSAQ